MLTHKDLVTFDELLACFPDPPDRRALREAVDRLGLWIRVGRKRYFETRHWPTLLEGLRCSSSANAAASTTPVTG